MTSTTNQTIASKTLFFIIVSLFTASSVFAVAPVSTSYADNGLVYQSVSVRTTEKSVILDWKTVSANDNSYFEVERSNDLVGFKTIAIVLDGFQGEGNVKSYSFKEAISSLEIGQVAYYRLKQVDLQGNITYSAIIKMVK